MKQVTTTQERMFTGDIPRPVNMAMAIAIHILDPNTGMCQDPREGVYCTIRSCLVPFLFLRTKFIYK